jgi:hypothetical protein
VNDLVIDPVLNQTLYLATDVGVMLSTNDGGSWSLFSQGIPSSVPCHDLTIHNATRKLVVWTHGRSAYSTDMVVVGTEPVSNEIPVEFKLYQNYPNPFNPETKIKYSLPKTSMVKLVVYDALGKVVNTLVNEEQAAGIYQINVDGLKGLASGIYFYRISAGSFTDVKKMVLLK